MVIKVDRSKESLNCPLCKNKYNLNDLKPFSLIPCGHTYCKLCTQKLGKNCNICSLNFNQIIPDYEMMDIVLNLSQIKTQTETKKSTSDNNLNKIRPEMIHLINLGTKSQQLIGTTEIRKLLSLEINPPIDEVIQSGLIPKFVEFLTSNDVDLQFESAWALTNIASGNSLQTKAVVDAGSIPKFIHLLNSTNEKVLEQSIWALGNIIGDSTQLRDYILEFKIIDPLIKTILDKTKKISTIRNAVWCMSNLCRGKPIVNFDLVKQFTNVINYLLNEIEFDKEIITETLWCLSYLSDGTNDRIQYIIDNIDLKKVVQLLAKDENYLIIPCLRILGNIITGDDIQTQFLLDLNVICLFKNLLYNNQKNSILKEVCWIISNITAGTNSQIQLVIDEDIFPKIIEISKSYELNIKKEAVWAIGNAFQSGTFEQIKYLCDKYDIVNVLLELLSETRNNIIIEIILECIKILLEFDNKQYTDLIINSNFLDIICNFDEVKSVKIVELIDKINEILQ